MTRKSATRAADKAEMIQALFEHSSDLMHVVDSKGVMLLVNPAWTRLTGYAETEIIGAPALDFFVTDDGAEAAARLREMVPGVVAERDARIRTKDGRLLWMAARTQKLEDGCFIVTMRDAAAERARAQELENARKTRKLLGASAGLGIWEFDPRANSIWWSDEIRDLLGFKEETWPAERFYEFIQPRDRERLRKQLSRAVMRGEPQKFEHRIRARDVWLTMRVTVQPERLSEGVYLLKGMSEDITELAAARDAARKGEQQMKKARRDIAMNAARLNLALEAAEAGVYEIDHVRKTFWCSPEFERITGQKNSDYDEAIDLRYPGFHPDDLPHVRASFRALHRGDKQSGESFEARIIRPDGTERWVRVFHHLQVTQNGRWLKAVGLVQDCDILKRQELALKEAQRAAEAGAEAKAAFLANMSHEIRTPMNGVMGVLHLLKTENLTEDGRALLSEALSCGAMLSELLNDVIDFSKIEAGRLEMACEPVDPGALVAGVVRLLEPQARAKDLRLVVQCDPGVGWVTSDPVRLRQALFNLIGNAVKFTETGHVLVRTLQPAPGVLRFEVEDSGVGIPAAAQARLFERFNQADASTTRRFGGSGLGLAITRRLAELMHGDVGFTSVEGHGSTFWIEVRAETTAAPAEPVQAAASVLDGVRVLVVEDNATNRLIATKLLENLGADVETADDGYAGVEAAQRGGFDLILMDIQMPGIDGVESARRIRAMGGMTAATPIVALTANVLAHQRASYLDAGMDGVVGKPIAPDALVTEIVAAANRRAEAMDAEAAAA
ncbi:PAS domain-containing hybrid sensor histidine kinase/response regulator [Phenylobacterium sp.]|uniref:PAS domain-containing hybrid sensor histidine kinase/response regulator n=1 Tax=Phenylobacterium sp. TaxID=1871053 RepID=UPI0025D3A1C5|nr:PAS domain S-box protein [Phenylobacterium sp.]